MNDDEPKTLTPKLRFPEFRKAKEWDEHTLKQLTTELLDGDWIESKDQSASGLRLIQTGNVGVGVFIGKSGKARYISEETFKRLRCTEVFPGDCLVSRLPDPAGRSCFLPDIGERMITAVDCTIVRFDNRKIVPYLFVAHSQTDAYFREVAALSSGSTRQRISRENLSTLLIALPGIAEQQQIADCLTSLDDLIAAQGRKVEALQAHKKGLMQQLFPREGETVPRLRFPEFRKGAEWTAHPFEHFVTRSFYGTSSSTSETGRYPVLRMGNMVDGGLSFSDLVYLDLDSEAFDDIRLMPGDILLNRTNSLALVGKISLFDRDIECITASYIVTYRLDKERIDPAFCNLMLNTPHYRAKINALARPSVSQANINPTTFRKELVVSVPPPAEQQRIADCLSSLDAHIAAAAQKLAALKTHKQALMQQLFPAGEE